MTARSLFSISLIFLYCGISRAQDFDATKSGPLKVGVIQSLTGIAAEDGKTVVQALQLAAADIRAAGLPAVELLIEDDGSQSKNAVSAFHKLRAGKVEVIVGATWDFTTNVILPLSGQTGVPLFNTSTLPESLKFRETGGPGFINAVTAVEEAGAFRRFLQKGNYRRAVIVFANNSWGETQVDIYRRIALEQGAEIADEVRTTSYDANEWGLLVSRIRQKDPDLVLLLLNKNDLEVFLRKARDLGLNSGFFTSKNLFDAIRASRNREVFEQVCFTYPFEQLEKEKDFNRRYQKTFGEEPRIYADATYDALFIIAKAAGLSRGKGISMREALRLTEHDGIVGHYKFREDSSFSLGSSSLVCVEDGKVAISTDS